jgi:processive 1,2-diacylglycerol beta-glucosyltransferase
VITDHVAHTFWTYTDIDGYFVGSEHVRRQLMERGVLASQIHVTGIPVDPSIAEPKDAATERRNLDLPDNGRIITLLGGGVSSQSVHTIARGILERDVRGTLVVVAGRNENLLDEVSDLQRSETMDLRLLGYIDYMDSLITASDLVITKAGGLIISEVLARGVPLIVIDPILGHEEWNADFVVNSGSGVQLRMPASVPEAVVRLFQRSHILADMRECAAGAGRPGAAQAIVEQVITDFMRSSMFRVASRK